VFSKPVEGNNYYFAFKAFADEEKVHIKDSEIFMINIIYFLHSRTYRMDYLLAFVALMTWIKTIFLFRITQSFGPMFKIIVKMFYDLGKFLIVWCMVLLAFSCISTLIFGNLKTFDNLNSTFLYYF